MLWHNVGLAAAMAVLLTPSASASVLSPEGFVWMGPFVLDGQGWYSYTDPAVVEVEGLAISVVNKLTVVDAAGPWMRAEARRIEDGMPVWNATFAPRLGAPPQVSDGEVLLLVGEGSRFSSGHRQSVDSVLAIDAATGKLKRTIPIPGGSAPFGTMTVAPDRLFLAIQGTPPPAEGSLSTTVMALDRFNGELVWESSVPGYVPSVPVVTAAGVVLSTAGTGTFSVGLNSGNLRWAVPGSPFQDPIADSMSVFIVSELSPYQNKISRIEQFTGGTLWSNIIPWSEWQPRQPVRLGDDIVVVVGGGSGMYVNNSEQKIHVAAFQADLGKIAWQTTIDHASSSSAVASDTGLFVAGLDYGLDGQVQEASWAFAEDGDLLWKSRWSPTPAFASDGVFVGMGTARVDHRFGEFQLGQGWIALNAGAGIPEPPAIAFDGPAEDAVHMQEFLEFEDRSQPGDRPISRQYWSIDSGGNGLESSYGPKISFWQQFVVSSINVTLTVVDDQMHQNSTTRSYAVLPYEAGETSSIPGLALWSLLAVLAVALVGRQGRRAK